MRYTQGMDFYYGGPRRGTLGWRDEELMGKVGQEDDGDGEVENENRGTKVKETSMMMDGSWEKVEIDGINVHVDEEDQYRAKVLNEVKSITNAIASNMSNLDVENFTDHVYWWLKSTNVYGHIQEMSRLGGNVSIEVTSAFFLYFLDICALQCSPESYDKNPTATRYGAMNSEVFSNVLQRIDETSPRGRLGAPYGRFHIDFPRNGEPTSIIGAITSILESPYVAQVERMNRDFIDVATRSCFVPGLTRVCYRNDALCGETQHEQGVSTFFRHGFVQDAPIFVYQGVPMSFQTAHTEVTGFVLQAKLCMHRRDDEATLAKGAVKLAENLVEKNAFAAAKQDWNKQNRPCFALGKTRDNTKTCDYLIKEDLEFYGAMVPGQAWIDDLDENAPMLAHWASRIVPETDQDRVYSLAFVNGFGQCETYQTSLPKEYGPEHWSYIPYVKSDEPVLDMLRELDQEEMEDDVMKASTEEIDGWDIKEVEYSKIEILLEKIERTALPIWENTVERAWKDVETRFVQLSECSGTVDWKLFCFGRFVAPTAYAVLNACAIQKNLIRSFGERFVPCVESLLKELDLLDENKRNMTIPSNSSLKRKKPEELQDLATKLGLCDSRTKLTKNQLISLISSTQKPNALTTCLLSYFNLAPGIQETNQDIFHRAGEFLSENRAIARIIAIKNYGVIHRTGRPCFASTCDAIMLYVPSEHDKAVSSSQDPDEFAKEFLKRPFGFAAGVIDLDILETEQDIERAKDLGLSYGKCNSIIVSKDRSSSANFSRYVPDGRKRTQLLSHSAFGTQVVFHVQACLNPSKNSSNRFTIIRSTQIHFDSSIIAEYEEFVRGAQSSCVGWILDPKTFNKPGDATLAQDLEKWNLDVNHLNQAAYLARALVEIRSKLNRPLPAAKTICPRLVHAWEQSMAGSTIETKRYGDDSDFAHVLFAVQPDLELQGPLVKNAMLLSLACIYNAYNCYKLFKIRKELDHIKTIRELHAKLGVIGGFKSVIQQLNKERFFQLSGLANPIQDGVLIVFPPHHDNLHETTSPISGHYMTILDGTSHHSPHLSQYPPVEASSPRSRSPPPPTPAPLKYKGQIWDPIGNVQHMNACKRVLGLLKQKHTKTKIKYHSEEEVLKLIRQSSQHVRHEPSPLEKGQRVACVLCCSLCEKTADTEFEGQHTGKRHPPQTRSFCIACGAIPLCTKPRKQYAGMTCFDIWHDPRVDTKYGGDLDKLRICGRPNEFGKPFGDTSAVNRGKPDNSIQTLAVLECQANQDFQTQFIGSRKRKRSVESSQITQVDSIKHLIHETSPPPPPVLDAPGTIEGTKQTQAGSRMGESLHDIDTASVLNYAQQFGTALTPVPSKSEEQPK